MSGRASWNRKSFARSSLPTKKMLSDGTGEPEGQRFRSGIS
jgi:hypothetical protein